jgi:hypothetical protein
MLSSLQSHESELKTKGIVAAAQDPDTNVTAEDAKRVIANESRKAGIAAYSFDRDASPEEKAAAAAAVCLNPKHWGMGLRS